jgi:D-glycero-alpha-D-manno-heptose-7-phosphate kinase
MTDNFKSRTGLKRVKAVAPIRICDIGGWTDTWFAGYGSIFNIAVYPYVEVQIEVRESDHSRDRIHISVENYRDSYDINPKKHTWGKHPLLEAAFTVMDLPDDVQLDVNIYSDAPPGASTGTSAAAAVALIGALDALTQGRLSNYEAAALAQSLETEKLGLECGIQDQLASSFGGINFIQMHQYPHASVSRLEVPNSVWWELEQRLAVFYIGAPHNSSEIHRKVIELLGPQASENPHLERMRKLAAAAKNALLEADFNQLGQCMDENTEAQRALHPGLVCESFEEIIDISATFNVAGCKVNGAGGDGGSVTILCNGDMATKRALIREIERKNQRYRFLPIYLSRHGLRVWTG